MRKYLVLSTICIVFMMFGCAQNPKSDSSVTKTYTIGDTGPSGVGTVFYVTDGGLHGLEAAPAGWNGGADDPTSVWSSVTSTEIGVTAQGTSIGTGLDNSYAIRIQAGLGGDSAAAICRNYTGGGKFDWFLPSKDELNELVLHRSIITGYNIVFYYWSSSEYSANSARAQRFADIQLQATSPKSSSGYYIRAIRAF